MSIKLSEIREKANAIIKDIFKEVLVSNDKKMWKRAFEAIDARLYSHTISGDVVKKRIWKSIKNKMSYRYGKRFVEPFIS